MHSLSALVLGAAVVLSSATGYAQNNLNAVLSSPTGTVLTFHLTGSRVAQYIEMRSMVVLSGVLDGTKVELAFPTIYPALALLPPGDYEARVVWVKNKKTGEMGRKYELTLQDGTRQEVTLQAIFE